MSMTVVFEVLNRVAIDLPILCGGPFKFLQSWLYFPWRIRTVLTLVASTTSSAVSSNSSSGKLFRSSSSVPSVPSGLVMVPLWLLYTMPPLHTILKILQQAPWTPEFAARFAYFHLYMGVLCFIFLLCSVRTNVYFFLIFLSLVPAFSCLAAAFWKLAEGTPEAAAVALKCQHAAGGLVFAVCILGWYLFAVQLLASVDFPINLPVGDLSKFVKGASEKKKTAETKNLMHPERAGTVSKTGRKDRYLPNGEDEVRGEYALVKAQIGVWLQQPHEPVTYINCIEAFHNNIELKTSSIKDPQTDQITVAPDWFSSKRTCDRYFLAQ